MALPGSFEKLVGVGQGGAVVEAQVDIAFLGADDEQYVSVTAALPIPQFSLSEVSMAPGRLCRSSVRSWRARPAVCESRPPRKTSKAVLRVTVRGRAEAVASGIFRKLHPGESERREKDVDPACLVFLGAGRVAVLRRRSLGQPAGERFIGLGEARFPVEDDDLRPAFQMDAHGRIPFEVAVATGLRAAAEVEQVVSPETVDGCGVRAARPVDGRDPVDPGLSHPLVDFRPGEQSFAIVRHTVGRIGNGRAVGSRFSGRLYRSAPRSAPDSDGAGASGRRTVTTSP